MNTTCGVQEEEEEPLVLDKNPLEWSVQEVVQFITSTDCAASASIFQEQVSQSGREPRVGGGGASPIVCCRCRRTSTARPCCC